MQNHKEICKSMQKYAIAFRKNNAKIRKTKVICDEKQ